MKKTVFAILFLASLNSWAARKSSPPVPGTPSNLTGGATSPTTVHLLWNDNSVGEDGFKIERSADGTTFTVAATAPANATSYDDTGLPDNSQLFYRVTAFDGTGKTPYSNVFDVNTPQAFYTVAGRVVEGNDFGGVSGAVVTVSRGANIQLPVGTPNRAIPDNNSTGITESFTVPASGAIDELSLAIKITHSYIGDLKVALVHPDGTRVVLHENTGGSANNIDAVYPTTVAPAQPLTVLKGKQSAGVWKIEIQDLSSSDSGTFVSYQMTFTGAVTAQSATTDAQGYYSFSSIGSGVISVSADFSGMIFAPRTVDLRGHKSHLNFVSELPVTSFAK